MKFLAFWKLRSKSWGTKTLLVPQPKSWGTSLPRSPRFLRPWIWSPCTARDIDAVERVQRRFSKCSRGYIRYSYPERLHRLQLQSLKLKRLITDLLWCYKIVSNVNDIHMDKFFVFSTCTYTREHPYKLYKRRSLTSTRANCFAVNASLMFGIHCLPTPYILHRYLSFADQFVLKANLSSFVKRF